MPKVVELNKKAPVARPAATVQPPADAVAATAHYGAASLVAEAEAVELAPAAPATLPALKSGANVPAFLKTFAPPPLIGGASQGTNYVGFASDGSANWPAMQAAKLDIGEPFVYNGSYVKLPQSTLRFWLVACESFKTVIDAGYNFLYTTRNLKVERVTLKLATGKPKTFDAGPGGVQEHYCAFMFALVNDEIIPVKGDFMGTKSAGFGACISAVRAASDPQSGWLDISDAHKITGQFPHPFGRVMCNLRTRPGIGKGSGKAYHKTLVHVAPSTLDEMGALVRALGSTLFTEASESAHKSYLDRIKFLDETAAKVRPNVMEETEAQAPAA